MRRGQEVEGEGRGGGRATFIWRGRQGGGGYHCKATNVERKGLQAGYRKCEGAKSSFIQLRAKHFKTLSLITGFMQFIVPQFRSFLEENGFESCCSVSEMTLSGMGSNLS